MSLIGQTLGGRYKVEAQLGEGGMATVYKAADIKLPRYVALKILRTDKPLDDSAMDRFKHEAETLAKLGHTNIVPILDFGEYEDKPYLVMPYLSGGTLRDHMKGSMHPEEAARILIPIAQALGHAHQKHVIHRDVKPTNILFNEDGAPMLSDFGIVKILDQESGPELTTTGMTLGTPAYMAPEQVLGKTPDARADVYSLGVVFYEMVTGRKPYVEDTPMALAARQALEPPPHPRQFMPSLPESVDSILMTALANQPERRFSNMNAFANALRSISGSDFTPTPSTQTTQRRGAASPPSPYPPPDTPYSQAGYGRSQPTPQAGMTRRDEMFPIPQSYAPQKKSRTGLWIGLGVLGVALVSGLTILIINLAARPPARTGDNPPQQVVTENPDIYFAPPVETAAPLMTEAPVTTAEPVQPESTYFTDSYGSSVMGRPLNYSCIGTGLSTMLLVGGIHGDEPNTVNLMYDLDGAFYNDYEISSNWKVCVVYDMNPDASAVNGHFNSNGVDLNRNWETSDWVQEYTRSDGTLYKGGGTSPFSEPETYNLKELIQNLGNEGLVVTVFYHSTQTGNSDIRPAYYGSLNWDGTSDNLARIFNSQIGYSYNRASSTSYTGESLKWCGENGYTCFGVEIPNNGSYDVTEHIDGLIAVMNSLN